MSWFPSPAPAITVPFKPIQPPRQLCASQRIPVRKTFLKFSAGNSKSKESSGLEYFRLKPVISLGEAHFGAESTGSFTSQGFVHVFLGNLFQENCWFFPWHKIKGDCGNGMLSSVFHVNSWFLSSLCLSVWFLMSRSWGISWMLETQKTSGLKSTLSIHQGTEISPSDQRWIQYWTSPSRACPVLEFWGSYWCLSGNCRSHPAPFALFSWNEWSWAKFIQAWIPLCPIP